MQEKIAKTQYPALPQPGTAKRALALPNEKRMLIEALDDFVKRYQKHEEAANMMYAAAINYYQYGHYKEALARLEDISLKIPSTPQAVQSVEIVLAHFMGRKEWQPLLNVTKRLSKIDALKKAGLSKTIKEHADYAKYMLKSSH